MLRGSWIGGGDLGVRDLVGFALLVYYLLTHGVLLRGVGASLTWVWHSGQGVCSWLCTYYIDGSDHGPGWKSRGVMVVRSLLFLSLLPFRVCR